MSPAARRARASARSWGKDLRPYRVAYHQGLVRCAQLFHRGRYRGKHHVHVPGQQLVGHAGEGILLMDGGMDTHLAAQRTTGPLT